MPKIIELLESLKEEKGVCWALTDGWEVVVYKHNSEKDECDVTEFHCTDRCSVLEELMEHYGVKDESP